MTSALKTVHGNIVDPIHRSIIPGVVRIAEGRIVEITHDSVHYPTYLLPGFIDAHVHVESSMLAPSEFARVAVTHGTVATISDPHEIANVLGIAGVNYMIENGQKVPFKFYFGAPSCVPATPFETAGAAIGPGAVEALLRRDEIRYLSEMMNFPGVIHDDADVWAKLEAAKRLGKPIDGHAPGLRGEGLRKYAAAGISTDHESIALEEALEKLSVGMKIIIREGSAARNFDALHPLLAEHWQQAMFCSDDKHPDELVIGHIDELARRALRLGYDLFHVLHCTSVNPVLHYGLEVGLLREGDPADFVEVTDLQNLTVIRTFINGELVAENGGCLFPGVEVPVVNHFKPVTKQLDEFRVPAFEGEIRIIEAFDGQIVTGARRERPATMNGEAVSDSGRDLLKLTVVNRYADAPPAVAFIANFGLKDGAIASTVAHDSHNIVAVGVDDQHIRAAVNLLMEKQGGICAVSNRWEEVLPLPVAGLMSPHDGSTIAARYTHIDGLAKQMGSRLRAPFMTLSFMALPVIPHLKLTDKGLFDVDRFDFADLWVQSGRGEK